MTARALGVSGSAGGALGRRVAIAGDAEGTFQSRAPAGPGQAPLHFILLATSE